MRRTLTLYVRTLTTMYVDLCFRASESDVTVCLTYRLSHEAIGRRLQQYFRNHELRSSCHTTKPQREWLMSQMKGVVKLVNTLQPIDWPRVSIDLLQGYNLTHNQQRADCLEDEALKCVLNERYSALTHWMHAYRHAQRLQPHIGLWVKPLNVDMEMELGRTDDATTSLKPFVLYATVRDGEVLNELYLSFSEHTDVAACCSVVRPARDVQRLAIGELVCPTQVLQDDLYVLDTFEGLEVVD